MTQILILHPDPRKAARKLQNRKLPQKLFVEVLQLLSTALRMYDIDDPRLMEMFNDKHPCAQWVASSKAHFRWAFEHAVELHNVYEKYCKKKKLEHKSLPVLRFIGSMLQNLPSDMPDEIDPDEFYDRIEAIRNAQSKKQRLKAGPILRAYKGIPDGCSCVALSIESKYHDESVHYDDDKLHGIGTYSKYHDLKHPLADGSECPWLKGG